MLGDDIRMIKIKLNYALNIDRLNKYNEQVKEIHNNLNQKKGLGSEFLGWMDLPNNYNIEQLNRMKKIASNLKKKIDYLIVIGIGGSYLGARAAIEMINGLYSNEVKMIYLGNTMSSTYTSQILDFLKKKKYGICVISKSGTTTEPAIAFRLMRKQLIGLLRR